ncbi:galactose oxidase-like domain-containing protein [Gloeocapsopsis sp. IPPAS B-1203]|uniref:galactose oxidase-like domain-containing protein n=1 Tax=Gloeocapsopsis sp. IPPAS B-1203 TaxID=2049454 RepID=UPI000C17C6D9|nr:galactose oxidase-like domain-containing protein [Gloeocapsopsis sp. IPPAS B-1203]PIG91279.1 galactose oxidase [Gloeocapsopsis sp. IPPAS B-1203]
MPITKISGDNQSGTVGTTLSAPLVVRVNNNNGSIARNVLVQFSIVSGSGSVSPASVRTNSSGQASTTLTLGTTPGTVTVRARTQSLGSVTFTATANATAATDSWQLLSYNCPINPIHGILLRTGKVFFVAGSGNDPTKMGETKGSAVWNVSTGTFFQPLTPVDDSGLPLDLFCGGHSFLPDGRLMFAGGTLQYDPFYGSPLALAFDPITEQWIELTSMNSGRWYPTVVTLGDGRVLAVSGYDENGLIDAYPEIYSSGTNSWTFFTQQTSLFDLYAHLFLLADGRVFYSGGYFTYHNGVYPRILTLPTDFTQPITEQPVNGLQDVDYGGQAASVMLPPAQDQKVMIIGGANEFYGQATKRVSIVDLKTANPSYTSAAPLNYARMHHNAVILPDRTIFVCNGSAWGENESTATRTPEIYNPATNTWKLGTPSNINRLYHAIALLLPDGRVVAAGGNRDRTIEERRLEIYSPAYMQMSRPVIQSAPQTVAYGGTITINTPQAANIKWVNLIKPMATTHGLETDQRLVDAPIASRTSTSLNATVTTNRNIATPGWYMLSITDNNNVPSVATWIQLT